jgi:hypothetical protein
MARKQVDRRLGEKPARQNPAGPDGTKPDAVRRMAEGTEARKGLGKLEGTPIDRPLPKRDAERDDRDLFDQDRSDRESGRPIQLEDDGTEPALGGGRGHEGFREGEKTQR